MTPEYGAATQLEKIDMLDFADLIALNKFDKRGAQDALRDVRKQYKRARQLWDTDDDNVPVFGTIASQFNDPGTNHLYRAVIDTLVSKCGLDAAAWKSSYARTDGRPRRCTSSRRAGPVISPRFPRRAGVTMRGRSSRVRVGPEALRAPHVDRNRSCRK